MSELKPCPFCGAGDNEQYRVMSPVRDLWQWACAQCGARGPRAERDNSDGPLIAAWNTRATPPRAEVDVELASRAIDNAILLASVYDGVAIDGNKVIADLAALRRALARATGWSDAT